MLSKVLVVYHGYNNRQFPVLYGPALPGQAGKATFKTFFSKITF